MADPLSPDDQAWFVTTLHLLSRALMGNGAGGESLRFIIDRLQERNEAARAVLEAPPRRYLLTSHRNAGLQWPPKMMLGTTLAQAAASYRPAVPTGLQAAKVAMLGAQGFVRDQAPAQLEAAQAAWRAGEWNEQWESAVRLIAARARQSRFEWGPNQLALIDALTARDRDPGSPFLGPLRPQMTEALREGGAWAALLREVMASDGGAKPAKSFAAKAQKMLRGIAPEEFAARVFSWLDQHPLNPAQPDPDAEALKQLVWLLGTCGESAAGPLGRFAQRCFIKVPAVGARSVKLGNAALAALGLVEPPTAGAAELDRLRQRIKYPSALKQVEAALKEAAKRAGLTTEDLAEIAIPDFDLQADATFRVETESGGATLALSQGRRADLAWHDGTGKPVGTAPAALKKAAPDLVKDMTERHRALGAMLAGQITRLERFFEQDRAWPAEAFAQRYLRHALLGPLARRLIWQAVRAGGETVSFLPREGALIDASGAAIALEAGDRVRLWHPIDAALSETLAWRAAIEAQGIVQPFKQAHREIYRLTDAERETATHSNRFAGHILRQHQMLELAKSRGWTGTLQGTFDGANNPRKEYPEHGICAEFECEGIEGGEGDLTSHGICIRVATGGVRFRPILGKEDRAARALANIAAMRAGQPLPVHAPRQALADLPPRLLSEAFRDVDLFVAVTSLGADPAWTDGGPNGRFGDYWRQFANSELTETGETRRAALAALLPRLAIGAVCTLESRHLIVRASLKTYRIHLGSGSIFFEPDGQYLCIVPARGADTEEIPLPFEGDAMLSAILSKAVMLARDDEIRDPSIRRQIRPDLSLAGVR